MADPTAPPGPDATADPTAALSDLAKKEEAAASDYGTQRAKLQAQADAQTAPAQQGVQDASKSLSEAASADADPKNNPAPLPPNLAKHLDPKVLSDTASAFMAVGALFGLVMRQPLTAALGNMTAAMKGVQEGDADQYDRAMAEYKTNVDAAEKQAKSQLARRKEILDDKNLDLTAKLNQLKIIEAAAGGPLRGLDSSFKTTMDVFKAQETAVKNMTEHNDKVLAAAERVQEHRDREQDVRMRMAEMGESRAAREANTIEGKYGQFEDLLKNGKINQEQFDQAVEHLTGVKSGSTMRSQALRVQMAANQVSKSLESIVGLPIGASSGFFGNRTTSGGGLLASSKETLTNKATEQEVQSYRVMAQGLQRSLATLEAGGVATGLVGLTKQMDGVILQDGDTNMTKLNKLAETRQIFQGATEVLLSEPGIPKEQKVQIQGAFDKVKKLIPFTQNDLNKLQYSSRGATTLGDVVGKTATAAGVKSQGPTLQEFMQKAKAANPNATEKELSDYYKNKYGGN